MEQIEQRVHPLKLVIAGVTVIALGLFGAFALGGSPSLESGTARAQITDVVIGSSATPLVAAPAVATDVKPGAAFDASEAVLGSAGSSVRIVQANRFWDYVTCITGVGVPIGFAIGLATSLGTVVAFNAARATGGSILPGMAGVMFRWYGQKIWNACWRFIKS